MATAIINLVLLVGIAFLMLYCKILDCRQQRKELAEIRRKRHENDADKQQATDEIERLYNELDLVNAEK